MLGHLFPQSMNLLTLITWLWISIWASTPTVTVFLEITDIRSSEGKLLIAVYTENDEWLDEEVAFYTTIVEVTSENQTIKIPSLPNGNYGVAVVHDLNGDEKLSFNWLGIPKEGYGFSNNPDKTFRKPTFEEAKVQVKLPHHKLSIDLYHW